MIIKIIFAPECRRSRQREFFGQSDELNLHFHTHRCAQTRRLRVSELHNRKFSSVTIEQNKETASFVVTPSSKQGRSACDSATAAQRIRYRRLFKIRLYLWPLGKVLAVKVGVIPPHSLCNSRFFFFWPGETQLAGLSTCLRVWFSPCNGWPKVGGALCPVWNHYRGTFSQLLERPPFSQQVSSRTHRWHSAKDWIVGFKF